MVIINSGGIINQERNQENNSGVYINQEIAKKKQYKNNSGVYNSRVSSM